LQSEVLRYKAGFEAVDEREAYLDHIVLNGYGGPGVTDILFDDLEVAGSAVTGSRTVRVGLRDATRPSGNGAAAAIASQSGRIDLRRSVILADGRPLFVRIIEHNGESFRWLKDLGFNTVWLNTPPSQSQLAEADEAEVWLLCPPPPDLESVGITDEHLPVLAWLVERSSTSGDESAALNTVSLVRRLDPARRPIVTPTATGRSPLTTAADVLMAGRRVFGTSFDIKDYGPWLRDATRASRERPFWGTVQTQLSVSLQRQFSLGRIDWADVPPALEQIRLSAFTTIAAGARGICFRSHARLDRDREASVLRAKILQLVNAELSLLAPWAAGAQSKELPAVESDTRLTLLDAERSRMLVAMRHASDEQYEPQARANAPLSLPPYIARLTDNAYLLTPHGLQPLHAEQAAGSLITLKDPDRISFILLTQDPLAISRVGRDLAAIRNNHVRLSYEVATARLNATATTLSQIGRADAQSANTLDQAGSLLERAAKSLRAGDYNSAWQAVRDAGPQVQQLRRTTWDLEVRNFTSPAASPLCASFATLPLHREAEKYLATGQWSENLLPAAGFESLDEMLRSGWRQAHAANVSHAALVELTPQDPAAGRSALRLVMPAANRAEQTGQPPGFSVTSPPIPVRAHQVVRIHGWVDIPGLIADRRHRLMIVDSLNGEDLAERIMTTHGWQEFTLYRLCPADGDLRLTFGLISGGEVRLDDVSVSVLR
jgi:hypothetical protein